jgi:phage baseplate assembly protein gpV
VSAVVPVLRAVVRDELADVQPLALGAVTSVVSNGDGSGAHNVEVNVRLHGSALELQRVPVLTSRVGLSAAPRVGDTAVVAFVGGDLNGPVVLGSLYDDQQHPPKAEVDEIVYEVPDDASSKRRVEIVLANGNTVSLLDDNVTITMGGTKVDVAADGAVTVEAATDLVLKAGGDVKIEAGGNVEVDASANATLKAGANATVEGSAAAKLKGATTTIAGTTSFSPS